MTTHSSQLSPKMESLAIPSSARRVRPIPHGRQHSAGTAAQLRLSSLPRFHPANFPSQNSSTTNTPATGPNSPQPPLSPRTHQKQYSDAQRQMFTYYTGRHSPRGSITKPTSPRLIPMGSPGPVTPLELEDGGGYLTAGSHATDAASHVDQLIREEARRRGDTGMSPARPTSVGGR